MVVAVESQSTFGRLLLSPSGLDRVEFYYIFLLVAAVFGCLICCFLYKKKPYQSIAEGTNNTSKLPGSIGRTFSKSNDRDDRCIRGQNHL